MTLTLVAAAALVNNRGEILLTERPAGKIMAGLWEFPGGKLHAGETPEAALARDLQEELAILVQPQALEPFAFASHAYGEKHVLLLLYLCRAWKGELQGCEGQSMRWCLPGAMQAEEMPPADVPLIKALQAAFP